MAQERADLCPGDPKASHRGDAFQPPGARPGGKCPPPDPPTGEGKASAPTHAGSSEIRRPPRHRLDPPQPAAQPLERTDLQGRPRHRSPSGAVSARRNRQRRRPSRDRFQCVRKRRGEACPGRRLVTVPLAPGSCRAASFGDAARVPPRGHVSRRCRPPGGAPDDMPRMAGIRAMRLPPRQDLDPPLCYSLRNLCGRIGARGPSPTSEPR